MSDAATLHGTAHQKNGYLSKIALKTNDLQFSRFHNVYGLPYPYPLTSSLFIQGNLANQLGLSTVYLKFQCIQNFLTLSIIIYITM